MFLKLEALEVLFILKIVKWELRLCDLKAFEAHGSIALQGKAYR